MISSAFDLNASTHLSPLTAALEPMNVPRITIDVFCESPEIAATIESACSDRRLARARVTLRSGDVSTAAAHFACVVTPDLIVLETRAEGDLLLDRLDRLAEVCAATTNVVVIGHSNDISLYRALMQRGVADYLLAPLSELAVIRAISRLYRGPQARPLGKVVAFIGAKGGAGSSTVAHNVAWSLGHRFDSHVLLADLDLPFGTADLDFNLDPNTGVLDALKEPDSLDELKLDRLLAKLDDHLSLLAAPADMGKLSGHETAAFERLIELAVTTVPFLVLDLPHVWADWSKKLVINADEVVITAEPDLANFRNTKAIVELLQQARPHDAPPRLILNRVGTPRRPEINVPDFVDALRLEPIASLPFDPKAFGTAANKGQMIAEHAAQSKLGREFSAVSDILAGRGRPHHAAKRGAARLWKTRGFRHGHERNTGKAPAEAR